MASSTPAQHTPDSTNSSNGEICRYTVRLAVSSSCVPVPKSTSSTSPASAMFSAAYQQAAVSSLRRFCHPKAAAVAATAVASLYAVCTG